ncbi:hypothetical protein ACEU6E_10525 (plasmid) [Halorutilales archaeon Cl-col2-1]
MKNRNTSKKEVSLLEQLLQGVVDPEILDYADNSKRIESKTAAVTEKEASDKQKSTR